MKKWLSRMLTPKSEKLELILELLGKHGELFGLDIVKRSDGMISLSSVYIYLSELQDAGLVTYRALDPPQEWMLPRHLYRLTGRRRPVRMTDEKNRPMTYWGGLSTASEDRGT